MASMDQGVAAVLGGLVGVGGATATAVIAAWGLRWQTRAQTHASHHHWRRQVRRDAYLAFLAAGRQVSRGCAQLKAAMHSDAAVPLAEHAAAVSEAKAQLIEASQVVELEGPERLVEVVVEAFGRASELEEMARRFAAAAQDDDFTIGPDQQRFEVAHDALAVSLQRFRRLARDVLEDLEVC